MYCTESDFIISTKFRVENEFDFYADAREQRSGDDKPSSLSTLLRQRPILGIVTVIITAFIISALIIGGYYWYLHSHQRK